MALGAFSDVKSILELGTESRTLGRKEAEEARKEAVLSSVTGGVLVDSQAQAPAAAVRPVSLVSFNSSFASLPALHSLSLGLSFFLSSSPRDATCSL